MPTQEDSNVQNTRNVIKLETSKTLEDKKEDAKQSVFGGPLSVRQPPQPIQKEEPLPEPQTSPSKAKPADPEPQPPAETSQDDYIDTSESKRERKMKKRLQLKNLIITKFRNKYDASNSNQDDVNSVIQKEVDLLFEKDNFDERDLVAVDRKIRAYIHDKKQESLQKEIEQKKLQSEIKKSPEPLVAKRATIATARLLENKDGSPNSLKHDLMLAKSKTGTMLGNETQIALTRLPKPITNTFMSPLVKLDTTTQLQNGNGSLKSARHKLQSHTGSRSISNNQLSQAGSEYRNRIMGQTGTIQKPKDIFRSEGANFGVKNEVQEKNKLASQLIHKRLLNGGGTTTSKNQSPLARDFDFDNVKSRGHTANYSQTYSEASDSRAMMFIRARQDDYWNKIAQYNRKLYQLEKEEAKQKKLHDQAQLRKLLHEQMEQVNNVRTLEIQKDHKFMKDLFHKTQQKTMKETEDSNQKRRLLQEINQERSQQQRQILEQWKNDRKQLHDYHNEVLKKNKEKEIEEKDVRAKLFQARLQAAKENAEKYHKSKADERQLRDQEKLQFSPLNLRSQATGATNAETASQSGAYATSSHFNTLKAPTPVYDDVFNDLFADKRHQAYRIIERVEKRTQIIQDKFQDNWSNQNQVAFDKKIHEAYLKMQEEFSQTMDNRKNNRDRMAQETKEFQFKQMRDKANEETSYKKTELASNEKERRRLEKFDEEARRSMRQQKEKQYSNQEQLMRQMEQRQMQNLNEDLMHRIDYKLNSKLIKNLEQPVLVPRENRKPF